jgi:hypothetical protein
VLVLPVLLVRRRIHVGAWEVWAFALFAGAALSTTFLSGYPRFKAAEQIVKFIFVMPAFYLIGRYYGARVPAAAAVRLCRDRGIRRDPVRAAVLRRARAVREGRFHAERRSRVVQGAQLVRGVLLPERARASCSRRAACPTSRSSSRSRWS